MDQFIQTAGWICIATFGVSIIALVVFIVIGKVKAKSDPVRIADVEVPALETGFDLGKRYDIAFGANSGFGTGVASEKLCGVRFLGYLKSENDAMAGPYGDNRWLVVELSDGKRGYVRPLSVVWIIEADMAGID